MGEHIGHAYNDHGLLQPGLEWRRQLWFHPVSEGLEIYLTAKRKMHKSSLSAELSGFLEGKVHLGWSKRTQGCNAACRLVWCKNPLRAALSPAKLRRWVAPSVPNEFLEERVPGDLCWGAAVQSPA